MLVLPVSKNLDKLLEDGGLAASTPLCELCRVVVMAVNLVCVFVVAVLCTENSRADGAGEMLNMVFPIKCSDVGSSKSPATFKAQQIESSEVINLAQRVLAVALFVINGKKFRGHDLPAVL